MTSSAERWYVVQSQPNAELKAVEHLKRQGFATYLPRYTKCRRHARRIEHVPAPLFPRYLFVGLDMAKQRWRSISSTVGVAHLVCNGEAPIPIAQDIINALKAREDERGLVRLQLGPNFRAGDKVRVLDGAFADCLGFFESMRDSDRVAILLDLLGRKVRVTVDVEGVAAA
jgi:transcriptional antiterminator RfaH